MDINDEKAAPAPKPRWLWLAVAFLVPPVGIILGVLHRRRDDGASRDFARAVTAAALFGLAALVILYVVWFAVLGAADLL